MQIVMKQQQNNPYLGCCKFAAVTSIALWLQVSPAVQANDVPLYEVRKGLIYTQADANPPSIDLTNGYAIDIRTYQALGADIINSYVKVPTSNYWTQLTLSTSQNYYELKHKKNKLSTLNADFPDGTYFLNIQTAHDGTLTPSLSLTGAAFPGGPHISNFAALQSVNANGYFRINWDSFAGGTTFDYMRFEVDDTLGNVILQTPNLDSQGLLDGTAAFMPIAPGVLLPGLTYKLILTMQKNMVVDRVSQPGTIGAASYFSETHCDVVTGSALAPDTKVLELSKATLWLQSSNAPAVPESTSPFEFNLSVKSYLPGILTTGAVVMPAGAGVASRSLVPQTDLLTLAYVDVATAATNLDTLYGLGNYTVLFNTPHDGPKSLAVPLQSVSNAPIAIPHLQNVLALQGVNAGQDLLVSWDPWTNAGPQDFIQLRVKDQLGNTAYETPDLGKVGWLNGASSNATIKAGHLIPGQTYDVNLFFKRSPEVNVTDYPGVLIQADYYARTKSTIQTLPSDAVFYSVFKGLVYSQTSNGAPALSPTNGYVFNSLVKASAATSVASAVTVTPPGASRVLTLPSGSVLWSFEDRFSGQAAFDTAYPVGAYAMNVLGNSDGLRNLSLTLSAASYPNAPQVFNYSAAQALDSAQNFTLSWIAFGGSALNRFIQLKINDSVGNTVFSTPGYGAAGALSALNTNVIVPAGTLASNRFYQASLVFQVVEVADTTTYPGALGLAGLSATTQFRLGTRGPGNPSTLSLSKLPTNHWVQATAQVVPGQSYRLDATTNFPAQWVPLMTNSSPSNLLWFIDTAAPSRPRQFYRLKLWP